MGLHTREVPYAGGSFPPEFLTQLRPAASKDGEVHGREYSQNSNFWGDGQLLGSFTEDVRSGMFRFPLVSAWGLRGER